MKYKVILLFLSLLPGLLLAQTPVVSSGKIVHIPDFSSRYVQARNIDIWLPEGYNPEHRYPVLYMQDGQMLFDGGITWNHQEWAVDETATTLIANGETEPFIVVGIWNGGIVRHSEYCPQKPFESLSPAEQDTLFRATRSNGQIVFSASVQSDSYLKFIVTELKPYIETHYSVDNRPSRTWIAGSSMGGLISLYAICEYPEVFGGAACISTHWPLVFRKENNPYPDAMMKYLRQNLPSPQNHRLYFDHGTATLDAMYAPFQKKVDKILRKKGFKKNKNWQTRVFPGEEHSEKAWNKRLKIPLLFLMQGEK
ncbi:MAG: alpha/beta hydrolase [Bacteroidia bacterium]|nr:alpha/beta hydrolase [Bacteroidia bacterium]